MSGKRNVDDIILSSRNDKLLRSIRSTQVKSLGLSQLPTSATDAFRAHSATLMEQQIGSGSLSTVTIDILVQKIAEMEHSLNTLKQSLPTSAHNVSMFTDQLTDLEIGMNRTFKEKQSQINSIKADMKNSTTSLETINRRIEEISLSLQESSRKTNSLFQNETLRDEILVAHDKALTSLLVKLNELSSWSVRMHGSQEEIQRRLVQIDTALLSMNSTQQDRRIAALEATVNALVRDFNYYKQEMQHALTDIHSALALRATRDIASSSSALY